MKILVPLIAIYFSVTANAAFTECRYQAEACDQFGNHFACEVVGWTGPNPPQFCSADDKSTGPGRPHVVMPQIKVSEDDPINCTIASNPVCVSSCMESERPAYHNNCAMCDIACGGW